MDFSRFTTISFDCYGTLIDWESGILPAIRGVLNRRRYIANLVREAAKELNVHAN